jgi:hypothetical protein
VSTFVKALGFKFPSIPTGSLRIILDSIAKEILGLDPGLEKSIAGGKSGGKTHLWIAFDKNLEIFRKLAFMNSTSGEFKESGLGCSVKKPSPLGG